MLREYIDARLNLSRRLVAAVCINQTLKGAEREASRHLWSAVMAVAAIRSNHSQHAGWAHMRRVRDLFENQSPPENAMVLFGALDTVHAPATPHDAEELYRHALDPYRMHDAESLPTAVYAAATANALARNADPAIYVQDARVQFNMWLS